MNAEECHSIPPTSKRFRRDMWNSDEMSEMSVSIFCCNRKPFETFWQLLIFAWVTPVQVYKVHIHSIDEYTVHACIYAFILLLAALQKGALRAFTWRACGFLSGASAQPLPIPLTGPCRAKWRAGVISSCQKMAVTRLHMPVGRWVSAGNYIKRGDKGRGVLQSTVAPANPWR